VYGLYVQTDAFAIRTFKLVETSTACYVAWIMTTYSLVPGQRRFGRHAASISRENEGTFSSETVVSAHEVARRSRDDYNMSSRGVQIPGARAFRRLTFVRWRLIFVGPQCRT
jgi:hypothetical protein